MSISVNKKTHKPKNNSVPKHWPHEVEYLSQHSKSSVSARNEKGKHTISTHIATYLIALHIIGIEARARTNPIVLKPVTSATHPCYLEYGAYNGGPLPNEQYDVLAEYTGVLREEQANDGASDYVMGHSNFATDAGIAGNETRFINDYRGYHRILFESFVNEYNLSVLITSVLATSPTSCFGRVSLPGVRV
jgi:hypothetical protein